MEASQPISASDFPERQQDRTAQRGMVTGLLQAQKSSVQRERSRQRIPTQFHRYGIKHIPRCVTRRGKLHFGKIIGEVFSRLLDLRFISAGQHSIQVVLTAVQFLQRIGKPVLRCLREAAEHSGNARKRLQTVNFDRQPAPGAD